MVTILITSKDNPLTFNKSFESIYKAALKLLEYYKDIFIEIIIVSPYFYNVTQNYFYNNSQISIKEIKDEKKGKPLALNKGVGGAEGEFIFFTDGDIILERFSLLNLYTYTIENVLSIAGGKPASLNGVNNILGYWSWVLVEGNAHKIRKKNEIGRKKGIKKFFPVSGYLFILKKELYEPLDMDTLSDDALISYTVFKKGYNIGYCETSIVYVKYPDTYKDYIKQKIRSSGGYMQSKLKNSGIRSFRYEVVNGVFYTLIYAKNFKEFLWSILLLLSRIHIWILILYNIKIRNNFNLWEEIKSSKGI